MGLLERLKRRVQLVGHQVPAIHGWVNTADELLFVSDDGARARCEREHVFLLLKWTPFEHRPTTQCRTDHIAVMYHSPPKP